MPALDQITISLPDLQNIMETIRQERYTGQEIKIIDAAGWWTIRDSDDMCIKDIRKTQPETEAET